MNTKTLLVKPNLTLQERISAGKYYSSNKEITERLFPHDPSTVGKWEWKLIPCSIFTPFDSAKKICEEDGWQAAKVEHLLSLGEMLSIHGKGEMVILPLSSSLRSEKSIHSPALWNTLSGKHILCFIDVLILYRHFDSALSVRKIC